MKNLNQLYIELLVSAVKNGKMLGVPLTSNIFESFIELEGNKNKKLSAFRDEYKGTTRGNLKKLKSVEKHQEELSAKIQSFENLLSRIEPKERIEICLVNFDEQAFSPVYNFYRLRTGQKRKRSVKLCQLQNSDLLRIQEFIRNICESSLELEILKEVNDQLNLIKEYVPSEEALIPKKSVAQVADACKEVYYSNTDISVEELAERVLNEFHIRKYNDLSPKRTEELTIKASKQWYRDQGLSNQTK